MSSDFRSCLLLGTRGIKARHRHLLRDLKNLLPHAALGSKLDTEDGLSSVLQLCEDRMCGTSLLLDARDRRRLYMWAANCPDGPSIMFRILNVHTVAELKLEAHRVVDARNVLVFDRAFGGNASRRVMKAVLTQVFSVPRRPGSGPPTPVRHTLSFAWLDDKIWLRVYRITYGDAGTATDIAEIGPRIVMRPIRIIASGFGGAILHDQPTD